MRILLVDDSGLSRSILKALFGRLVPNCTIKRARTGEVALEIIGAEKEPFDIITIDLYMPGMNGFEVAEELKKRKVNSVMALITADKNKELVERSKKLGLRYMLKPITEQKVREVFNVG